MFGIAQEHVFDDRRRLHVDGEIAAFDVGRENGDRVERRRFIVFRELARDPRHRLFVGAQRGDVVRLRVERVHRPQIRLFARRGRFRLPRLRRRRERVEHLQARLAVAVAPERMRMRQRFSPIRHRERGIGLPRLRERFRRIVELEAVEQQDALDEVRLRGRVAGRGEVDAPERGDAGCAPRAQDCADGADDAAPDRQSIRARPNACLNMGSPCEKLMDLGCQYSSL